MQEGVFRAAQAKCWARITPKRDSFQMLDFTVRNVFQQGSWGRLPLKSGRVISRDVACDKMTMYMDLLCLCHSTCLRYNESAGLTRRCMSFYARRANCQPPLIAPFDLCRLNSEHNSYIRITTQAESALSCGGYW